MSTKNNQPRPLENEVQQGNIRFKDDKPAKDQLPVDTPQTETRKDADNIPGLNQEKIDMDKRGPADSSDQ